VRRTKKNIRDHVDSERKSLELLAWLVWIGDDHSGLTGIVVDARRTTGWPCGISTCKLAVCVAKLLQWRADEWRQITSCSPRRRRRRRRLPRCNQQCSITTVTISDRAISVPRCNRHQQATQTQTPRRPLFADDSAAQQQQLFPSCSYLAKCGAGATTSPLKAVNSDYIVRR